MKIIEEQLLLNNINNINKFVLKHKQLNSIFKNIEKLKNTSLQDLSVTSDLEFFDEISFILSVITSIVSHPRIITKGEDVIIRAELAPSIEGNGLIETLQDSRLWKQKQIDMVPEYVHYHQSTDEIATYENRFIVLVINIIESELNKYSVFYESLIQTFTGQTSLSLDKDKQDDAIEKITLLLKKIKFIKNTYFYKVVSKKLGVFKSVQPTNILLKNRLYNYCFKFYRKRIMYVDKTVLERDFKSFYFFNLIKVIKDLGFNYINENQELLIAEDNDINIPNVSFTNVDFTVTIKDYPLGLIIEVMNDQIKGNKKNKAIHLLLFDIENGFNNILNNMSKIINSKDIKNYETVEALSLWKKAEINNIDPIKQTFDLNVIEDNVVSEEELMKNYILNKISNSYASKDLYERYCPICKCKEIETENNVYKCMNCHSIYTFYKDNDNKQSIWFIRLRRGHYGRS